MVLPGKSAAEVRVEFAKIIRDYVRFEVCDNNMQSSSQIGECSSGLPLLEATSTLSAYSSSTSAIFTLQSGFQSGGEERDVDDDCEFERHPSKNDEYRDTKRLRFSVETESIKIKNVKTYDSDLPKASPIPYALPNSVFPDASPITEDSLVLSRDASAREPSPPASYASELFPNRSPTESVVSLPNQARGNGHVLNILCGANGENSIVKAMKSFFAEELEACAKNFISFKELEGLFLLYVGHSTPQAKSLFKFYCKTLLIDQFPCAENKNRDNKKGYVNVRHKRAQ